MTKLTGLFQRGSSYYIQVVLPKDHPLASKYKNGKYVASLGRCSYREANLKGSIRRAEVLLCGASSTPNFSPIAPPASTLVQTSRCLRDVFERWQLSGDKPKSADAINAMDRALRRFESQHPSLTLNDISRELGDRYRAYLHTACVTPKTARDQLVAIKSLLKYASRTLEWTDRNVWEGLDIKAKTTNKRRPIRPDEVQKLFSTAIHQSYELPRAANAGHDAAYWIPLLGAYTGARLGELCQLRACDVRIADGLAVLDITDAGANQRIKTEAGRRTIPIHTALLRLGFIEYVKAMRDSGNASLWPKLPLRRDKPSDNFGRWFRGFRKSLDMDGPGCPTFHYFRHAVRPMMRRAGYSDATMDKVTGHETGGSIGTLVYDHWELVELMPAVEAITHTSLSLPQVSPYGFPFYQACSH